MPAHDRGNHKGLPLRDGTVYFFRVPKENDDAITAIRTHSAVEFHGSDQTTRYEFPRGSFIPQVNCASTGPGKDKSKQAISSTATGPQSDIVHDPEMDRGWVPSKKEKRSIQ